MIAVRVFLYVSIPLLILSALKGGGLSADYLEMVIYIIPFSILLAAVVGVAKKDLQTINNRVLNIFLVGLIGIWGIVSSLYLFGEKSICAGFDSCEFLTVPKILTSFLISFIPIAGLKFSRKSKAKND